MKFFTSHKKTILLSLFVLFIAFGPFGIETANAFIMDFGKAAIAEVFAALLMIPITLSSWLLGISGILLNWILDLTVVDMKGSLDKITGINIAWSVIRDLSNMVFIFSLLYVSIGTILKISGADWKKTITSIVIAAVLINFSLLMTKVIVDASNIVTLGIYRQIIPNDGQRLGFSNKIMGSLGIVSLYKQDQGNTLIDTLGNDLTKIALVSVGSSVFMIVAAFSFFAVAIMFIIRYVTIIFLLVFSPLAVMASVLPKLKGNSSKWWEQLSGQALFGPIYMILTWVVLTIISSPGFVCTGKPMSGVFSSVVGQGEGINTITTVGQCSEIGMLFNFIVIIALMIGTLTISKSFSNQKSAQIAGVVGSALGFGASAAGWGSRKVIGGSAQKLADSKWLKDKAATSRVMNAGLMGANKVAKSSFDVRSSRFAGMGKSLGMGDLGIGGKAGGKDGYSKMRDEKVKKYEARGKTLEASGAEEKAKLKTERGEAEKKLTTQLEAQKSSIPAPLKDDPSLIAQETAIENEVKGFDDQITEKKTELAGVPELDRKVNEELAELEVNKKAKADELEQAKKARLDAERVAQEAHKKATDEATKETRERLEKIGWEDKNKYFTDDKAGNAAKEKYKKEQKQKADDYEAGKARVQAYADRIETPRAPGFVGGFKIPFAGSRAKKTAAEKLRKGKKSVKDQLDDLLKENGDVKKEEKEEKTEAPGEDKGGEAKK